MTWAELYIGGILRRQAVLTVLVTAVILVLAGFLGTHASLSILVLLLTTLGVIVLLQQPLLGLLTLTPVALLVPLELRTGTEVSINPATMLVPILLILWLLNMVRRKNLHIATSRTNKPLLLFLFAGLFSLLVGNVFWDPSVPQSGRFILVQVAQWAIFAFSAGAFWLTGNLIRHEVWLRRLISSYLTLIAILVILLVIPQLLTLPGLSQIPPLVNRVTTSALHRAPFWVLLAAISGGQLFFNRTLSASQCLFLLIILGAVLCYVFLLTHETASNWVGVTTVMGVLAWLRWPRLRWPVIILLLILVSTGLLSSTLYNFAGGDAEWEESGGSRMVLTGRVLEVTMRNPITGLGPAAYRRYAAMKPLIYEKAFYIKPGVSSHNNYVDLFSHVGLLGLGLFFWFATELTLLGFRLRAYFTQGFAAGYVNGMLAAWAGALVLMLFADWILPFVYNIGFPGFQASVLVWLFLGGLVALEQIAKREAVS